MRVDLAVEMVAALPVLHKLEEQGYQAFFVGGSVRDYLLGRQIHDIDIATDALPEVVMSLFASCIPTGLQHGTVTVPYKGEYYEVTTFRSEGSYNDHRRPAQIQFESALSADLLRRDFTMNAMAISSDGRLYDPYGGQADLTQGLLRTVGAASQRFSEDALRMLRAVRFMGKYKLRPVPSLWKGLRQSGELLGFIAMERVQMELEQVITAHDPEAGISWLAASGLLHHTKASLGQLPIAVDTCSDTARAALPKLKLLADPAERWALLLLLLQLSVPSSEALLSALRVSKERRTAVLSIMRLDDLRSDWISAVLTSGKNSATSWIRIQKAWGILPEKDLTILARQLEQLPATTIADLAISGTDLVRLSGRGPGRWIGAALKDLLKEVAAGEIKNDAEALATWIQTQQEKGMYNE